MVWLGFGVFILPLAPSAKVSPSPRHLSGAPRRSRGGRVSPSIHLAARHLPSSSRNPVPLRGSPGSTKNETQRAGCFKWNFIPKVSRTCREVSSLVSASQLLGSHSPFTCWRGASGQSCDCSEPQFPHRHNRHKWTCFAGRLQGRGPAWHAAGASVNATCSYCCGCSCKSGTEEKSHTAPSARLQIFCVPCLLVHRLLPFSNNDNTRRSAL